MSERLSIGILQNLPKFSLKSPETLCFQACEFSKLFLTEQLFLFHNAIFVKFVAVSV